MQKYIFKPYNPIFPELFLKEKKRISNHLETLAIEHIGSTAVENLGGKGIIDIAIACNQEDMHTLSKQLQDLGYEFRETFSTPDRLYFITYLPDPEEERRRYHIHLTYPESTDWKGLLEFRDYLRANPSEAQEYADIKKNAALTANQDGKEYRKLKDPMFKKVQSLLEKP